MRNLFIILAFLTANVCAAQGTTGQQIALKMGDTLDVTRMEITATELIFYHEGIKKGVAKADVSAFYVNEKWYDAATNRPVGQERTNSIMLRNDIDLLAKEIDKTKLHLNAAGVNILVSFIGAAALMAGALTTSNPDMARIFSIGSAGCFVLFQVSAGIRLIKAGSQFSFSANGSLVGKLGR